MLADMEAEVSLLSGAGREIALLRGYTELSYTRRLNDIGDFTLSIPGEHLGAIPRGSRLRVRLAGAERDAEQVEDFGGIVLKREAGGDENGLTTWALSGPSYERYLAARTITPADYDPGATPPTAGTYDRRTGRADAVMKGYVKTAFDLASSLRSARGQSWALAGMAVQADMGHGNTLTWDGRYDNLLEALQTIAAAGGVDFALVPTETGLEFRTYSPILGVDRTQGNPAGNGSVVFELEGEDSGDTGGVAGWRWTEDAEALANHVIVLGQDELAARRFAVRESAASRADWGVWVDVLDASGTESQSALAAQGDARLKEAASAVITTEVEVAQTRYRYKERYDLGDLVSVDLPVPGVGMATAQITQVAVRIGADGVLDATPTIGPPPLDLRTRMRGLVRRIGRVNKR